MAPAYAQIAGQSGNINGTITSDSGAPIAGATVALASPSGTYTQHTDSKGYFSFLAVPTDTYTLSVEAKGFNAYSQTGVNVAGGGTLALGSLALAPENAVIGTVTAHSLASAFQPNQTIPQYTLSGQVLQAAAGKAANANEQQILLSVPGFQVDAMGNLILQGATRDQIRYQFDGVDFTDPGFSFNANNSFFNGISSVQVVSGAGDPSQPNGGAGSVNLLVKRGTYPAGGLLDLELNDRPEGQQINFQYGAATSNGRFSDFISYFGNNGAYSYGPWGSNAFTLATQPYLNQRLEESDFVNNFVFRFGQDNAQSLQVLYLAHAATLYGNYAAIPLVYDSGDPNQLATIGYFTGAAYGLTGPTPAQAAALLSPEVGQTSLVQPIPAVAGIDNTSLLKFEYDNQISANTNLALRFFHSDTYAFEDASANETSEGYGAVEPLYAQTSGGSRTGANFDIIEQVGQKQTITFSGDYEINHPNFGAVESFQGFLAAGANWIDFLRPPNPNAPVSAGNPCPVAGGCYLQQFFYTKGGTPPIPNMTLASSSPNIQFGTGIRDEIQLTHQLRLDLGLRYDIFNQFLTPGYVESENENIQPVPGAPGEYYVPDLGFTNQPHYLQPRIGFSFLVTPHDTVAATYGKSINIGGNGLYASPESTSYLNGFASIPVNPNWIAGAALGNADAPVYSGTTLMCYPTEPFPVGATASSQPSYNGVVGTTLQLGKPCANYAQALQGQQDLYYPEIANVQPAVLYNNDLSWAHVFGNNGIAMKIDAFNRQAYHVQQITAPLVFNPATNTTSPGSLSSTTNGQNTTTGVDLNLTLPEHPYGWSGFVSATYTNELTNTPASADDFGGQDFEPFALPQFAALNNIYRAGFVSPVTLHVGLSYKTRSGWRFNPVLNFNDGYPYNSGNQTPVFLPGSVAVNVPNTNVTDPYIGATGGNPYFVDPANPGSIFNPIISAARGNKEGPAGTELSPAQATMDFTIEFTPPNAPRNTFGIQFLDVFNNGYFLRAEANPNYYPVSTGVSGPLTGQAVSGVAGYPTYSSLIATNEYPYAPYIIPVNLGSAVGAFPANSPWENLPFTFRVYYQLKL